MNLRLYFIQQNHLFTVGNAGLILSMKETKVRQRQYCTAGYFCSRDQLFPYLLSGTSRATASQGHCSNNTPQVQENPGNFAMQLPTFSFFINA